MALNLLEDDLAPLPVCGGAVGVSLRPWEIRTFRLAESR
jgi:hypothetical protein